jgi:hypothetical protein
MALAAEAKSCSVPWLSKLSPCGTSSTTGVSTRRSRQAWYSAVANTDEVIEDILAETAGDPQRYLCELAIALRWRVEDNGRTDLLLDECYAEICSPPSLSLCRMSRPVRACGLKQPWLDPRDIGAASRPGVRIETSATPPIWRRRWVTPRVGVWIEALRHASEGVTGNVTPGAGVWIETISRDRHQPALITSRPRAGAPIPLVDLPSPQ